jgi:hypothetical protein
MHFINIPTPPNGRLPVSGNATPCIPVPLEGGAVDRHDVPPVVGIGDLAGSQEAALICEGRLIIQIQSPYLCLLYSSFKETEYLTNVIY